MILNHNHINSWQHATTTLGDLREDFWDHANIARALLACGRMLMWNMVKSMLSIWNGNVKQHSYRSYGYSGHGNCYDFLWKFETIQLSSRLTELPRSRRPRSDLGLAHLRWFSLLYSKKTIKLYQNFEKNANRILPGLLGVGRNGLQQNFHKFIEK